MRLRTVFLLLLAVPQILFGQQNKKRKVQGSQGNTLKTQSVSCSNWLKTPSNPSFFDVGQIPITGHIITVEALINRTAPYSGGLHYAGEVVSKHDNPNDVNYLLRPNDAEITTTDAFGQSHYFSTPDICEIELNKTYHVAMVYDGVTLKFYRNGFLMSQVPAT